MATETWVINETITVEPYAYSTLISFVSNNQNYGVFYIDPDGDDIPKIVYADKVVASDVWDVVYNYGWTNQAYRTVTFATPPTGNLLTWLQANGTKQQPTYKFKHWKKSNVVVNRTLVGEKYYYFKPYTILGLYTITTTLTNCTGASANATKIQENGDLTLTFTANSGYELPTGVSVTNVTSYNWNKATGVLAISKPTGDVAIEIVAVNALPQLATPQNVTADGTTVSWDEVENATSYEVFVDNVSIGTVEQAVTEDELAGTWVLNESITFSYSLGLSNIVSFNFTSNDTSFYGFYFDVDSDGDNSLGYRTNQAYSFNQIYNSSGNIISGKEAYKTITITSKLSEVTNGDQLLAWLQVNAVKQ